MTAGDAVAAQAYQTAMEFWDQLASPTTDTPKKLTAGRKRPANKIKRKQKEREHMENLDVAEVAITLGELTSKAASVDKTQDKRHQVIGAQKNAGPAVAGTVMAARWRQSLRPCRIGTGLWTLLSSQLELTSLMRLCLTSYLMLAI